jgi:hypothetical protein
MNRTLLIASLSVLLVFGLVAPAPAASTLKPLSPGGTVALTGTTAANNSSLFPATVQVDRDTSFNVTDSTGALIFSGELQDRVAKSATGTLFFDFRIFNTQTGLNGSISSVGRTGFDSLTTSVEYLTDGLGTVGASSASRSSDGSVINFVFNSPPIMSGVQSSYFHAVFTNAIGYALIGSTTITVSEGAGQAGFVTIPTYAPISVSVPEPPSLVLGCLALVSLGLFACARYRLYRCAA